MMPNQSEREKALDSAMRLMPEKWRARWCENGESGCGCMGCANYSGGLAQRWFTKDEHARWVRDNEAAKKT